jgi:hypothetical protein
MLVYATVNFAERPEWKMFDDQQSVVEEKTAYRALYSLP